MSKDQADYTVEAMKMIGAGYAAEIESPRTVKVLSDDGLVDYKVWGWVKTSAKFIAHIKRLKGAKLAIWQVVGLSIDENGECSLSANEIAKLSGYSRSEVIQSLQELDEMGYLSTQKQNGKKSMYKPVFVARGSNSPAERPVQKNDQSSLQDSYQSSPSEENSVPSYRELKELKKPSALTDLENQQVKEEANQKVDELLEFERKAQEAKTQGKAWRGREFVQPEHLIYADWWHATTGLEMYGARSAAKVNTEWLKAVKECWENELTIPELAEAYTVETWEGKRKLSKMSQVIGTAKAIHAAGKPTEQSSREKGKGFYA